MIAFVTSLRHPRNATNYGHVEALLRETLHSVTQQTCDDYVVIVVGNKAPSFPLPDKVHFVQVDFRAPAAPGERISRGSLIRDKGTKIGVGLIAARAFSPDYVMIFDADDFVHRDIAAFTRDNPGRDGWVVRDGWIYSQARAAYRPQPEFNTICGTCFIVSFEAYGVPADLDATATRGVVKTAYGERLSRIIGAHKYATDWYEEQGMRIEPLPFPGAVYHVDTGENHSGQRNELAGRAKVLDRRMMDEFGIQVAHGRWGALYTYYAKPSVDRVIRTVRPFARAVRGLFRRLRRG